MPYPDGEIATCEGGLRGTRDADCGHRQDRGDPEGVAGGEPSLGLEGAANDDPEAQETNEAGEPEPREGLAEEWDREDDDRHVERVRPQGGHLPRRDDEHGDQLDDEDRPDDPVRDLREPQPAVGLRVRFDDENRDEGESGSQDNWLKRRMNAAGLV